MENSFLSCEPAVFVVGEDYVITFLTNGNGLGTIKIGDIEYYEDNSGILATGKNIFRVTIPQAVLDDKCGYTICFRRLIVRRSYYSQLEEAKTAFFAFRPLKKTEDIHLYHLADVHNKTDFALQCASYFGDTLDVLILNGDITECNKIEDFEQMLCLAGQITHGSLPILFTRGNHDTRGTLAELGNNYYPVSGGKNYYTFTLGPLCGVLLDCGEDKLDYHTEYGGVNAFEPYRRCETAFLQKTTLPKGKIPFAVSHICPVLTSPEGEKIFQIEEDVYQAWNQELERMGIAFMLCGHLHRKFVLPSGDDCGGIAHHYPVIVGSETAEDDLWGTAITLGAGGMTTVFTNIHQEEAGKKYFAFQ